jgi:membrane fusion protein (multidrug efflux system)
MGISALPDSWTTFHITVAKEMPRAPVREAMYSSHSVPVPDLKGKQQVKPSTKKVSPILTSIVPLISLSLPTCDMHKEKPHEEHPKIVVTSPQSKYVIITQPYVCQIHAQRHINVRALVDGYLEKILVKEGQPVKKNDPMFKINPILYKAKYDAAKAEARHAELEYEYTKSLSKKTVVSEREVPLMNARFLAKKAEMEKAKAELDFTDIRAPFDGIVDTLHEREGSLIKERDILTTLSDNSVMWVYFNVPEARYLEFKARSGPSQGNTTKLKLADARIELLLADHNLFKYDAGDAVTVEAQFNNETGTIPFRADFPNPDRLLRHGQTGTVLIHQRLANALVIPQRAVFEILDKRYVYVVDQDNVAHQRDITVQNELEDIFVIKSGLDVNDKIVLEGTRLVRDGDKLEYEFRPPEEALTHQKYHAE